MLAELELGIHMLWTTARSALVAIRYMCAHTHTACIMQRVSWVMTTLYLAPPCDRAQELQKNRSLEAYSDDHSLVRRPRPWHEHTATTDSTKQSALSSARSAV